MSRCFCPDHKASMVLFLDRVYSIQNQNFLLYLVEKGFLPDLQAAVSMDNVRGVLHLLFFCIMHQIIVHSPCYKSVKFPTMFMINLSHSCLQSGLGGTDMALALNRYLCGSVLPLLSKCSPMLCDLPLVSTGTVDDFLQALYRLSKASSLTKAQHDAIQTCLLSVCG